MPEQVEPEIMTVGSDEGRSLRHRYRSLRRYAGGLGPWLRRHLGTPWRVGVALALAVALGVIGGGWAMDARADAAAQRRDAHAVTLAAFTRLVGEPGAASGLEVVLVNAGTRPVTVTGLAPSGAPVSSSEPIEPGGALVPGASTTIHLGLLRCSFADRAKLSGRTTSRLDRPGQLVEGNSE